MKREIKGVLIATTLVIAFAILLHWVSVYELSPPSSEVRAITEYRGRPDILEEWTVTAYCPCEKCCGKWSDGITASGKPAEGFFVAAPPDIPFGTLVVVHGYADGLPVPVWDRGNAIQGNNLDVFFPDHQTALNWGRRKMKVKFLKEIK